jgi:aryl-alcohol dehydrogenase-like predicted oxidoreductase
VPDPAPGKEPLAVPLGTTGVSVSRIALGTGTNGWGRESNQTRLGFRSFERLLRHGIERGCTLLDGADLYGSHEYIGRIVKSVGRDRVTLLSKVWFAAAPGMEATDRALPAVERFLRELSVETIDIVLIHCVTDSDWPRILERMRDDLSLLKQRGIVRAVGCSCHSYAALKAASASPWVDVVLARVNPYRVAVDEDGSSADVAAALRAARASGKGVIGMKIYGAGAVRSRVQRGVSLRHALTSGVADAVTLGHESPAQIDESLASLAALSSGSSASSELSE